MATNGQFTLAVCLNCTENCHLVVIVLNPFEVAGALQAVGITLVSQRRQRYSSAVKQYIAQLQQSLLQCLASNSKLAFKLNKIVVSTRNWEEQYC